MTIGQVDFSQDKQDNKACNILQPVCTPKLIKKPAQKAGIFNFLHAGVAILESQIRFLNNELQSPYFNIF